jgi:capsular exopolysaccharide synthesis family protein
VDRPIRTLLISSGGLAEGKTTTVANLAVAFGQMGKRVIAVDGDLRKPALHRYFDVLNSRGLTSALLCHDTKVEDYLAPTSMDNVYILPSGPLLPDSGELLRSQRMVDLIEELKTRADMVLFDSPPALPVADAMLLARTMDATLLVVAVGGTQPQTLKRTQEQLAKAGTHLVGLVLNRVTSQDSDYYYGDVEMQTRSKRSWLAHRKLPFSLSRKSLQAERSNVKL